MPSGNRRSWLVVGLALCGLLVAAGLTTAATPPQPPAAGEWWLRAVDATGLTPPPRAGVPVVIVDRGVDFSHPDLTGRPDTVALNRQAFRTETDDAFHGTAMASLIGARGVGGGPVGIYPQARLYAWDASPEGLLDSTYVLRGMLRASRYCPAVILLSFGLTGSYFVHAISNLQEGIDRAVDRGCLVVAAAGNARGAGSPPFYPAALRHVLTVAATDESGSVAPFSSASPAIDLAAPGVAIPAAAPLALEPSGYAIRSGTSYAAAIVAGAAAWIWTLRPTLSAAQIAEVLRRSARAVGGRRPNPDTGWGLLDVAAALRAPAPPPDPFEPNDDIWYDLPLGEPNAGSHPLTRPGHLAVRIAASVTAGKDPVDVYRVWVPAGATVTARLDPAARLGLRLWSAETQTIAERGADRRADVLAEGSSHGTLRYRGRSGKGHFLYLEVALRGDRPGADDYTLTVSSSASPSL